MLNSVQHYVKGLLDNLPTLMTEPIKAYVQPPQLADAAGGPVAYVWGGRLNVSRQTAPRIRGQQNFNWDVSVAVTQAFDQDAPNLESAFPLVLDQIMATVATTPLQVKGVWLTDPDTGVQTQLLSIGEHFSLDYTSVATTSGAGVGLWVFAADISFPLEEKVSFQPGTYYNPGTP